jgi:tetratricopeptide (TPR) repeat protein
MIIRASIYTLLLAVAPLATTYAQAGEVSVTIEDSTESKDGKIARTDELFFEALTARRHDDPVQATSLLKQLISARPEHAAAWFELARLQIDDKNMDAAIVSIKKAISLDTTNKWYREKYADMLVAKKSYAEAAAAYARLTSAETRDHDYPQRAAEYYDKAGNKAEALKYLDIALQRNVNDDDLMLQKVQLLLDMKRPEKAAEVVQQMIQNDPKNGRYYQLLGDLYDENNMQTKATELYEQAIKKLGNDPSVQIGLAGHSLRKGDTAAYKKWLKTAIMNQTLEASEQLELLTKYIQSLLGESAALAEALPLAAQLVAQDTKDPLRLSFYGEVLEAARLKDSAAIMYKQALAVKPGNFETWGRLLGLYLDKPFADSLIRYSEKALKYFPNQAIVHFYNGVGQMNKNNNAAAIRAITRAIDLEPETEKDVLTLMYSTLGDVYYTTKQYTESDEAFDKSLNLDPTNANVLNNYSYYLSVRGIRLADAEKMALKAMQLRPQESTYMDTYGWILYKKGNYQKAREYIQKAIDTAPDRADGTLYDHLGDVYYKLGEKNKATDAWKTAKEKGCDNEYLDKKLSEGKLYE